MANPSSSQENTSAVAEQTPRAPSRGLSARLFGREISFHSLARLTTKGGLAILEYGLISGSNFIMGVLLARWLSPDQYGAYALTFSIFLLLSFLYQALLLEPMSVYGGSSFRGNLRGYMRTALWIHSTISFIILVLLAISAGVAHILGKSESLSGALIGLTAAAPCIFLFWLGRRGFYLKFSPGPAALGAVFYFVLVTGGVFVLNWFHLLSSLSAFLLMALAALLCGTALMLALRATLEPGTTAPDLRDTWRRHWSYGKWALGSSVVGWIPTYIYFPIISSFSGIAHAGELRAIMNLAAPVLQTYAALSMLFLPYAARVRQEKGLLGTRTLTRRLTLLFTASALAYWAVLIPLRGVIFRFLYAGRYMDVAYLIPFFAFETIVWAASVGPSITLRAIESPRSLFIANSAASVVTFVIGIPATWAFGLRGVVWSIVLANTTALVIAVVLLGRKTSVLQNSCVNATVVLSTEESNL